MSDTSQLEEVFQTILDKIMILKSDIIASLQGNVLKETQEYINNSFDLFYYGVKYRMNQYTMEFNQITADNSNANDGTQQLQKAECVIRLQTLSSIISDKISQLIEKKE